MNKGLQFNTKHSIFKLVCVGLILGLTSCKKAPTFHENVASIIHQHCTPCHRPGGVGPFSLITYEQVKKKAKTIVKVTRLKIMPPWPADPNYSHFVGENTLTENEILLLKNWVEGGMKVGISGGEEFKPPIYRSQLGKPDLVLKLAHTNIKNDQTDRFYVVKIPGELLKDTWVRAIEFLPGSRLVHHVNGHLLNYDFDKKQNAGDGILSFETSGNDAFLNHWQQMKLTHDDGSLPSRVHSAFNFLPGVTPAWYPEGIGVFPLNRKFNLVCNDLHFGPTSKTIIDSSVVNIFFSKFPPKRQTGELMLGTNGVSKIVPPLVVPPNQITTHSTSFNVPADMSILTINPHLHLLGKKFKAYALKPNGDTVKLISIPRWDFRWQYFYTFLHPVKIPAGSVIVAEAVFDNTSANKNNPFNPPRTIAERLDKGGSGMRTTDEMFQFIITWMPYEKGDEEIKMN